MKRIVALALVCLFGVAIGRGFALPPNEEETAAKTRWLNAKFFGESTSKFDSGLVVLENHDKLARDFYGEPLNLGGHVFERGVYAHASSRILAILPQRATRFQSTVGVNSDSGSTGGRGSVVFSVEQKGRELFRSDVLREGDAGVAVDVGLDGASELTLIADDANDGNACDHAVWADARFTLDDGTELWLDEMKANYEDSSGTYANDYPFSFDYDGRSSRSFLRSWERDVKTTVDGDVKTHEIIFSEPNDGALQVRCVVREYLDFPAVEWTLYFKNRGAAETPVVENVKALDVDFTRPEFTPRWTYGWDIRKTDNAWHDRRCEFLLRRPKGSYCQIDDWLPLENPLPPGASKHLEPIGGCSTNMNAPYFNIQSGEKEGWIVVLGWPGQWSADFERTGSRTLHVVGGQKTTRFKLEPLEELRTPLVVVQPWFRDSWLEAQNVWRAWMIRHNVPRQPDGKIVEHHLAGCASYWYDNMTQADAASQLEFLDEYEKEQIPIDYWWMDAGWYVCDGNWTKTGTWEYDAKRFPNGLREITDYARKRNIKSIVWFEPERVAEGTWLAKERRDWLLPTASSSLLLNLGNPDALSWLISHVDGLIKSQGIDIYRQDFNFEPLSAWDKDAPDRRGVTENKHVVGFLKYWDSLRELNPNLRIDSCASGGRRDDLETMRRAIIEIRSDYCIEPVGEQCHHMGMSLWIPFHGSIWSDTDDYMCRSLTSPYGNICTDVRDKTNNDFENLKKNIAIWEKTLVPLYGKDFYPLAGLSNHADAEIPAENLNSIWRGWQYDDPEKGIGAIQMFRSGDSPQVEGRYKLFALEPDAEYEFSDVDTNETRVYSGRELRERGLPIRIENAPQAVIYSYKKR